MPFRNYNPYLSKTPRLESIYALDNSSSSSSSSSSSDEQQQPPPPPEIPADRKYVKCVVACQRAWRYRRFRAHIAQLKQQRDEQRRREELQAIEAENELHRQRFLEENERREQRAQQLAQRLAEMERERAREREQAALRLKCVLVCQRAVRMKRFRRHARALRHQETVRCALVVQKKWRLIRFRRALRKLKQEEQGRPPPTKIELGINTVFIAIIVLQFTLQSESIK